MEMQQQIDRLRATTRRLQIGIVALVLGAVIWELRPGPAPIASHSATYHELVRRGAAELGTTIADYRFHRFAISYPPIKSLF